MGESFDKTINIDQSLARRSEKEGNNRSRNKEVQPSGTAVMYQWTYRVSYDTFENIDMF